MSERKRIKLKVIDKPKSGNVVSAPPILDASSHTVDYTCGGCDIVLMHAEENQVYSLTIQCTQCGSYNATGA